MTISKLFLSAMAIAACSHAPIMENEVPTPVVAAPNARIVRPVKRERTWADTIKPLATLSKGWNRIAGPDGTGCVQDSTYTFKVLPGLPEKVLIYLNGGGACWNASECDPKRNFYPVDDDSPINDVSSRQGIFDYNNESNPFKAYTIVFVNYCTADMHLGALEVTYDAAESKAKNAKSREFAIRHGGAANLEAVLDYFYKNVRGPGTIFVAGSNTGAVASPVVAARMARHYPRARVVQLGEGAGAYDAESAPEIFSAWGAIDYLHTDPAYREVDSADFSFRKLYTAAGKSARGLHFAQLNSVEDPSQLAFLNMAGIKGTSVRRQLAMNVDSLRAGLPWFRFYAVPGKASAILRTNLLYSTTVEGTPLTDWITKLADGEDVDDVGSALLTGPDPRVPAPKPAAKPTKGKPKKG